MTTYSLDAEGFIKEVKKYREIWDLKNRGNRYTSKVKRGAWAGVARAFIPDFDAMREEEKMEVYRKLHSKWRNIRDAYVRNLKRNDGRRSYTYAKQLSFLNNIYTEGNANSEEESSDDDKILTEYSTKHVESQSDDDRDVVREEEKDTSSKRVRMIGITDNRQNIEFVDTPNHNDSNHFVEDEDRSFFESLLPAVREFDMDQKLEFRSEILRVIKDIRNSKTAYNFKTERVACDFV